MSQSRKDALVRWMLNTFADPGAPCPDLPGLTRGEFEAEISRAPGELRWIAAMGGGIPTPAMTAALAYFDGYRCESLPANLLQAQRDYFGAHQYERVDRPRGQFFHTNWTGRGGTTASSSYNA